MAKKQAEKGPVESGMIFRGQNRRKSGQKWSFWRILGHFWQKPTLRPTQELTKFT